MVDTLTKIERSALMAKVKGAGNASTELRLIAIFRSLGITGWQRKTFIIGKPDFVFSKNRVAIFVDGCFWHACPIHARQPFQNSEIWREKISRNQARDRLVNRTLRWISSMRVHGAMAITFTLLIVGFVLLDIGHFGDPVFNKYAGYELMACALAAWCMMARIILNDVFAREVLPAGNAWL